MKGPSGKVLCVFGYWLEDSYQQEMMFFHGYYSQLAIREGGWGDHRGEDGKVVGGDVASLATRLHQTPFLVSTLIVRLHHPHRLTSPQRKLLTAPRREVIACVHLQMENGVFQSGLEWVIFRESLAKPTQTTKLNNRDFEIWLENECVFWVLCWVYATCF